MADLDPSRGGPRLLEQLRLVAWVRWRGLRNGLRNKNRRLDLIGIIFAGFFTALFVFGACFGVFFATTFLFERHYERYLNLLFLGILVWWQLFPVILAGFAPQFSFRSLLRFPLSRPAFYAVGVGYGLADGAAIAALLWMTCMVAATVVARPSAAGAMALACASFAVLNVTIERLVGAWLERLLAKRRAREVLFTLFILSMICLQFLNPALQEYGRDLKPILQHTIPYFWILPSSFAGDFVAASVLDGVARAALRLAGLLAYVALFSALLWKLYAKLYAGEELSESEAPAARAKPTLRPASENSDTLSFLPPPIAAVFRKELRYLKRNTFLFFSLFIPPVMILFFTVQFGGDHPKTGLKHGVPPDVFFPGVLAYLLLLLVAPSYNSFAHESKGIQTYFTSPVKFREILLAKNLLTSLIVCGEISICVLQVGLIAGWPSPPIAVASLMAVVFSLVAQLTFANWSSLSFPKKMDFGKMQGQRNSGMAVLVLFGVQLLLGSISGMILFSGRWTGNVWLPVEVFGGLAAIAAAGYVSSLEPLNALAERKKDVLIDALCR